MLVPVLFAAALGATAPDCSYDGPALLALDQDAFDQDLKGGWRPLANRRGCEAAAADLLAQYRRAHPQSPNLGILYWHEGQVRAIGGDAAGAVPLLIQSRRGDDDSFGWNAYVDATVAFLQGDRPRLTAARAALAVTPQPPDWPKMVAEAQATRGVTITWPANLDVVDGLIACFGKPYREAYESACRPPRR